MSAGGEGTENLNKEGETPTAPVSEGIPICQKDEVDNSNPKDVESNAPAPVTKTESLEDAGVIEALIEKKLPNDKEKEPEVDSELDFELKWDDDAELNENQGVGDIDLDNAGKDLEGHVTSKEKDVEKEADSAFTSTETDLNSLGKTGYSFSSTERDLDSLDKDDDTSTSIDKDLDEETEGILSSIDKHLDTVGKEIKETISAEKDIDDIDSIVDDKHPSDMNINEVVDSKESHVKEIDNESNIVPESSSDGLLNTGVTPEKSETFNIDTNVRIDTDIKTSPGNSEPNSIDEQLVYSDAEDPDIEDKDLINEIDATDISIEKFKHTDTSNSSDFVISKKVDEVEIAEDLPCEVITSHKDGATTEKDQTEMDVDVDLAKSQMTQKSANDTDIKTSPINSEPNSMDEQLVYYDAEDPDIEDKDLINEIDATDISIEQFKHTDTSNSSDLITNKKVDEVEIAEDLPCEVLTSHKDGATTEKDQTEMDVDVDLAKSQSTKKSANDTDIKTSPINSEPNSLDEQLVYSDAEDPDIEDKDLINEIDATDISNEKFEPTDTPVSSNLITSKKVDEIEIAEDLPSEVITSHKNGATTEKNETEMDVDVDLAKSQITQKSASDTISSTTDMDTSIYDINNEHSLDRPDVMIDIPTQELIDTFDDADDTFDDDKGDSQSVSNIIDKLDLAETISKDNIENLTERIITEDIIIPDKKPERKHNILTDEVEMSNEVADNTAQIEKMELDNAFFKELQESESSNDFTKNTAKEEEDNITNPETPKPDEENVTTPGEIASHADIILEANTENPKASEDTPTPPEPVANIDVKEVEVSDNLEQKSVDIPNAAKNVDEAQPSTSKYHQESSDEDQEATDSLGLLAESSRVMDDDDEQEQEPEPEDDDDDDDFDQDDESNLLTPEHSEDSNAQHSEAEHPKETMEVDESNDAPPEPVLAEEADRQTDMSEMEESHDGLPDDLPVGLPDETEGQSDDINDDESSDEKDDLDIQIREVVSQNDVDAVVPESSQATKETQKAVVALLEDEKAKESVDKPPVAVRIEEKEVEPTFDSDAGNSKLRQLLLKEGTPEQKKSPSKTKKLEIATPKAEINIVELEESSSEDDIQVINKNPLALGSSKDVTSVTIPSGVEVMVAAAGETSDIQEKDGEVRVSGLPKPQPHKPTRLNTDEISIKTATATEPLVIPETTAPKTADSKASIDFGLEIYSLDSDDEETEVRSKRKSKLTAVELDKARQTNKCINMNCTSDGSVPLVPASLSAAVYYAANQQRGGGLCLYCAKRFEERSEKLVEGGKDLTPFLSMDMCMIREEFVEISDSDSEDEPDIVKDDNEIIEEKGAKFLEEQLAAMFNDTWKKFNMEERLLSAQAEIYEEVNRLEEIECKEIDAMLNECQKATDKLRNDLYATFADDRQELPSIAIVDTPTNQWSGLEEAVTTPPPAPEVRERPKRRSATATEPPAKRAAIPLGYEPLDKDASTSKQEEAKPVTPADSAALNDDDNADISVVKLSVEAAPVGLPPPGVATRAPLRPNMPVYAMRNTFGAWHRVRILEVQPKTAGQFTMCRVRFEQPKTISKMLPARCLAYEQPPDVRLTIGTRVVALFKDHRVEKKEEGEKKEAYYSGIVAEIPNPVNSFRYLIFFDDGYAQYVQHANTRLVCECAPRVWDEVHPFSRNFVRDYLRAYPERPMVRLHAGQSIKTEWDGKWWVSKVLQVDASLVLVYFEGKKDNKTEWIYRGSTRLAPLYLELQAAERTRARPLPRAQAARRFNMPYVEYTRSDETEKSATMAPAATPSQTPAQIQASMEQEIRRQRAVAKKSTALPPAHPPAAPAVARDNVTSRVVFYTPKNAIKPHKMTPHTCGPRCKRTDVLALKDLRTYNPLTKPLLSGWERQTVRYRIPAVKAVMYRAPCGRRIRNYDELHRYLQAIDSDMGVDLFDFNPATHCLAEFLLNKCLISKKDLSHGKENVPVPCVNYYDSSLPEFCSYNTERTPTAGVPLNLDPEFLCGCDCTDDCADKSKCACWQMTLEGARTIGLDTRGVGYVYKRLPEPLPSGIYECNSRCKCKQTCLNRVAQHPLQLKLQVFKTANRGWGIRALNDVPKGAFLCVYAGNLLTDATANLDGLNEGDEYLAELDYIEVVEQMKEGFEEDIPEDAKKLDEEENDSSSMSSSSDEEPEKRDADDDFRPALPSNQYAPSEYSKRLRKREKSKMAKENEEREKKQKEKDGEDCITISDDEELREPGHFSAQAGMGGKEFISKYKSVRTLFGKDEACYIMDAKVQGNIGRYLNHSCTPNVFVQNVFVDTHDPRFPWVAFFALSQIRAGTELTWNYNYDVGSVPGKVLYCYCNAPNCRGRLL